MLVWSYEQNSPWQTVSFEGLVVGHTRSGERTVHHSYVQLLSNRPGAFNQFSIGGSLYEWSAGPVPTEGTALHSYFGTFANSPGAFNQFNIGGALLGWNAETPVAAEGTALHTQHQGIVWVPSNFNTWNALGAIHVEAAVSEEEAVVVLAVPGGAGGALYEIAAPAGVTDEEFATILCLLEADE